jgi:hypothetical protein
MNPTDSQTQNRSESEIQFGSMFMSPQINEIAGALAKAQGEIQNPKKNKTAKVVTKTGGQYTYTYADLGVVRDAVTPALSKCGIAMIQSPGVTATGKVEVTTMLAHQSGQYIGGIIGWASPGAGAQDLAGITTYLRRYAAAGLTNVFAEDDTDGEDDRNSGGESDGRPTDSKKPYAVPTTKKPTAPVNAAPAPAPTATQHPAPDVKVADPAAELATLKARCLERFDDPAAAAKRIGPFLTAYLGHKPEAGAHPEYVEAMRLLSLHLQGEGASAMFLKDPQAVGSWLRQRHDNTERVLTEAAERRATKPADITAKMEKLDLTDPDEQFAFLVLTWHSGSAALAQSDKFSPRKVLDAIEADLGYAVDPITNPAAASQSSEVERLMIGLTTDPKSRLIA